MKSRQQLIQAECGDNAPIDPRALAQLSSLTLPTTGPNANQPLLTISGLAGLTLIAEYSDDLTNLQPLTPFILTGNTTPCPPRRFYRLRLP